MLDFIQKMPKAELHLHIEGTLEPELMLEIARRNRVKLPYATARQVKKAYEFTNLQSFLDLYYAATRPAGTHGASFLSNRQKRERIAEIDQVS